MGAIEQNRWIQSQMIIYRADGIPIDVSDYLAHCRISKGNIDGISDSGTDGVTPTMEFTLKSDLINNFSPMAKHGKVKYHREVITGNGTDTYTPGNTNIIPYTIRFYNISGTLKKWSDFSGGETWTSEGSETWLYASADGTIVDSPIVLNSDGTITFTDNIPSGESVYIQYSFIDTDSVTGRNDWNYHNGTYQPLLWERRRVQFRSGHGSPTWVKQSISGADTNRYTIDNPIAIPRTARLFSITNDSYYTESIYIDQDTNEFVLSQTIPVGVDFVMQYSYLADETILMFDGYLGDEIIVDDQNNSVTCLCRDQTRELELARIQEDDIRTYDVEDSGDYVYLPTLMQNIADDKMGTGEITIVTETAEGGYLYNAVPNPELWLYQNVKTALSRCANQIGWLFYYKYNTTSEDFKPTLFQPPRTKDSADVELNWRSDIKAQVVSITGNEIINKCTVYYYDRTANEVTKSSQSYLDQDSIDTYGLRESIIELDQTSLIDEATEALKLATTLVSDYKDLTAGIRVDMPMLLYYTDGVKKPLDYYTSLNVTYPLVLSEEDIFFIESIDQDWDFVTDSYSTVCTGTTKVRGYKNKWQRIIAEPGRYRPVTNRRVTRLTQMDKPLNLALVESGIENVNVAPQAYAVVSWTKPAKEYPSKYQILTKRTADGDYSKSIPLEVNKTSIKLLLPRGVTHTVKVAAVSMENIQGVFSDELSLAAIGDTTAPGVPSGLSLTGLTEGIQIEWTANTEADLLRYKIYLKKDSQPTAASYDELFLSDTNKITIKGLESGEKYYCEIASVDTSGNVSALSNSGLYAYSDGIRNIKTQAQLTAWIGELATSAPLGNDPNSYHTLRVHKIEGGTAYTWAKANGTNYYIQQDFFSIVGVDNPTISVEFEQTDASQETLLYLEVDSFVMENISLEMWNDQAGTDNVLLDIDEKSTTDGIFRIRDTKIIEGSSNSATSTNTVLRMNGSSNMTAKIYNNIIQANNCIKIGGDFTSNNSKIEIIGNELYGSAGASDEVVAIDSDVTGCYIIRNKIVDGGIILNALQDVKNIIIVENEFIIENELTNKYLIGLTGTPPMGSQANICIYNNQALYNANSTGGYDFYYTNSTSSDNTNIRDNLATGEKSGGGLFLDTWIDDGTGTKLYVEGNNPKLTEYDTR